MKKYLIAALILLFYSINSYCVETLHFKRFGTLSVYRPSAHISHVVFFLSGDGGWNSGTDQRARDISTLDCLVIGMDTNYYLKNMKVSDSGCYEPTEDFESLSRTVEKHLQLPGYLPPILLGYSEGATLVYGTLVQAPPHTFAGAISMGFCPEMMLDRPLCRGEGLEQDPYTHPKEKGYSFRPYGNLQDPWLVFQGAVDQVCDENVTRDFVKQVPQGRFVLLPKVGHGFRIAANWMPEFADAFRVFSENQPK